MKFIESCIFCKLREDCPAQYSINNSACITFQDPIITDTYSYTDVQSWLYLSKEEMAKRYDILISTDRLYNLKFQPKD